MSSSYLGDEKWSKSTSIFFLTALKSPIDLFLGLLLRSLQRSNCWKLKPEATAGTKRCRAKVVCGIATGLVVPLSSTESLCQKKDPLKKTCDLLIGCGSSTFDIRFLLMICMSQRWNLDSTIGFSDVNIAGLAWEKSFEWAVKQDCFSRVNAGWWK